MGKQTKKKIVKSLEKITETWNAGGPCENKTKQKTQGQKIKV